MKIVEITWIDIEFDGGWHTFDEADTFISNAKNRTIKEVGYLLEEDEREVVLVDSVTGDGYGTINVIPRGCIVSVTELVSAHNHFLQG